MKTKKTPKAQKETKEAPQAPREERASGGSFEQTFRNIDNVLRQEAGCTTELDYTEQTSWMLFLKYLDDLEQERELKAELQGKEYEFVIDGAHRWSTWAAPKTADGSFDHDAALTGDDLIDFVNRKLFHICKASGFARQGQTRLNIRSARSSAKSKTSFKAGTVFAMRSN